MVREKGTAAPGLSGPVCARFYITVPDNGKTREHEARVRTLQDGENDW